MRERASTTACRAVSRTSDPTWTRPPGKLPVRAEFAPASLIETLPDGTKLPLFQRWTGWRNRVRSVELRQAVLDGLELRAFRMGPLEGRVYLAFAQATLALIEPWQALRTAALVRLQGNDAGTRTREHLLRVEAADGSAGGRPSSGFSMLRMRR